MIDHVVVTGNSQDCRFSLYLLDGFNRRHTLIYGMPLLANSSVVVPVRLGLDETEELHFASDSDELIVVPRREWLTASPV